MTHDSVGWSFGQVSPQQEWLTYAPHGVDWGDLTGSGGFKMASFMGTFCHPSHRAPWFSSMWFLSPHDLPIFNNLDWASSERKQEISFWKFIRRYSGLLRSDLRSNITSAIFWLLKEVPVSSRCKRRGNGHHLLMRKVAYTIWKGVEDERGFYSHLQGHLPQSPLVVTTVISLPHAKYIPFSSPNQVPWQYSLETPRCGHWNQVQMHRKLLRSSSESYKVQRKRTSYLHSETPCTTVE